MAKRGKILAAVAAVTAVAAIGALVIGTVRAVGNGLDRADVAEASCLDGAQADMAKIRTSREWTEQDLPGLGAYTDIHWQLRTQANPCSRAPGPTDWQYQGVLVLRPADARSLREQYSWEPVVHGTGAPAGDKQPWPGLVPFVPAGVRWVRSEQYSTLLSSGPRWGELYLADTGEVALFAFYDH